MAAPSHPYFGDGGFLAFAHRGGALEMPENTMAAFAHAVGMGYQYLELDVRATSDGRAVVFHDRRLDRVTDATGAIGDLTWAELARVRVAAREPIPRIEEVFDAWPHVHVNIDAKDDAVLGPLVSILRRPGLLDRVCAGGFSQKRVFRLRAALGPGLCTAFGPMDVLRLRLASWLGLPPGRFAAACAQVPVSANGIGIVTPRFLAAARGAGVPVHVWTVDDGAEMRRLIDLGVQGLMTDRPAVLKAELTARGLWPK